MTKKQVITNLKCVLEKSGFPSGASGKEPTYQFKRHGFDPWVRKIPGGGGGGLATHSSIFVWRIPCTEKPEGLQSFGRKASDRTEAALHDLAQIRCGK